MCRGDPDNQKALLTTGLLRRYAPRNDTGLFLRLCRIAMTPLHWMPQPYGLRNDTYARKPAKPPPLLGRCETQCVVATQIINNVCSSTGLLRRYAPRNDTGLLLQLCRIAMTPLNWDTTTLRASKDTQHYTELRLATIMSRVHKPNHYVACDIILFT